MRKFPRAKKLTFFNNKGGVGKTTLAFNTAVEFANKGYKTVLIDLDPQCNLTRLALGEEYYENTLFSHLSKTIYDVLSGVINGGGDVDLSGSFEQVKGAPENLYLQRGDLRLSDYEELLSTAFGNAAAGTRNGYFVTSAIDRFMREKGMSDDVDIFVIDTSPTMGRLNRVILLGTDYFAVPMNPDAFSLQGIENLGTKLEEWKKNWRDTGYALSGNTEKQYVLDGEGLFIGYILNSYNVYSEKPIKDHQQWIDKIPQSVKTYLSEKHCRNGLVAASYSSPLHDIQDYGMIPALCHKDGRAIFDIDPSKLKQGTGENLEKAKREFDELSDNILRVIEKY